MRRFRAYECPPPQQRCPQRCSDGAPRPRSGCLRRWTLATPSANPSLPPLAPATGYPAGVTTPPPRPHPRLPLPPPWPLPPLPPPPPPLRLAAVPAACRWTAPPRRGWPAAAASASTAPPRRCRQRQHNLHRPPPRPPPPPRCRQPTADRLPVARTPTAPPPLPAAAAGHRRRRAERRGGQGGGGAGASCTGPSNWWGRDQDGHPQTSITTAVPRTRVSCTTAVHSRAARCARTCACTCARARVRTRMRARAWGCATRPRRVHGHAQGVFYRLFRACLASTPAQIWGVF